MKERACHTFPRLNVVFEGGEGVNDETQNVSVSLQHPAEEQVPLPIRQLYLRLLLELCQVLVPWKSLL